MEHHVSYEQVRNRPCDFRVKFRFYNENEGGRKTGPPMQGYRSDFMYEGSDPKTDRIYMIHPEFIDDTNNVILDKTYRPWTGKANMWILNPDFYEYHKQRIKLIIKGYFIEGRHKTAECEVIEIIGLYDL